jgi:hypothetical protein
MTKQVEVSEGPYGLIRVGECYVNQNGVYSKDGKRISTEMARKLLGLSSF